MLDGTLCVVVCVCCVCSLLLSDVLVVCGLWVYCVLNVLCVSVVRLADGCGVVCPTAKDEICNPSHNWSAEDICTILF